MPPVETPEVVCPVDEYALRPCFASSNEMLLPPPPLLAPLHLSGRGHRGLVVAAPGRTDRCVGRAQCSPLRPSLDLTLEA